MILPLELGYLIDTYNYNSVKFDRSWTKEEETNKEKHRGKGKKGSGEDRTHMPL